MLPRKAGMGTGIGFPDDDQGGTHIKMKHPGSQILSHLRKKVRLAEWYECIKMKHPGSQILSHLEKKEQ